MSTIQVPDGLPELRRGRHESPSDGACLMEYVSVLAGEPFSDRPTCVDPLLVRLAWAINDISAEAVRAELPELAPRFIGTTTGGPTLAPRLVIACCAHAQARLGPTPDQSITLALVRSEKRLGRVHKRLALGRSVHGDRTFRLRAEAILGGVVRALAAEDQRQLPQLLRVAVVVAEDTCRTAATGRLGPAPASFV